MPMRPMMYLMVCSLFACSEPGEPWPEGPSVRIDSPAQGQFVGTSRAECFELDVSGYLYNVERKEDFELYVQGKRVRNVEIRPTSTAGFWEFSTTIDLFPTNEAGMGPPDSDFEAEYPRYPWLASRSTGWENRVRPILAELIRPGDRTDLGAFVSRDLHTTIDVRRSNCQSWAPAWTQDEVSGVVATNLTPDGLVTLSPVMLSQLPHPELPSPQSDIDAQIASGVEGPTGDETCVSYALVSETEDGIADAHDTLVAAAIAANTAAQASSLPPVYPNPLSADNWLVCARWSSTFDYLGWTPPAGLLIDPRPASASGPPRLAATWDHVDVPFQLLIQGEEVRVGWSRLGELDPTMSATAALGVCATAGTAQVSLTAGFEVGTSTERERLEVEATSLSASASSTAGGVPNPCAAGAWREKAMAMMEDAAPWIGSLYEGAWSQGAPRSHPALAMRHALEGAIPGRWTAEADGRITTAPEPFYEGGEPGVCSAEASGLTLVHALEVEPGASGWEGGWLHWGTSLEDERDALSGEKHMGDPTTCHESDFVDSEWIFSGSPPTGALLFTTAYPNAVMGISTNARLDASHTMATSPAFVSEVGAALSIARGRWGDLVVEVDAQQPSFVSPEWHAQVGHWVVTVLQGSTDEVLTQAIFNLWATSGWDSQTTVGGLDDHATVSLAGLVMEGIAVDGSLRPSVGVLLSTFGPTLRTQFALHATDVAGDIGWPEWASVDGGPFFTSATDELQRWQDNRALLPYSISP